MRLADLHKSNTLCADHEIACLKLMQIWSALSNQVHIKPSFILNQGTGLTLDELHVIGTYGEHCQDLVPEVGR